MDLRSVTLIILSCHSFYVYGNFTWLKSSPSPKICAGENADLVWHYYTDELVTSIKWLRNNVTIADELRGKFTSYVEGVLKSSSGNAAILISGFSIFYDADTYICTVITNSPNTNKGTVTRLLPPSGFPSFTNKTSGTLTTLTCKAPNRTGTPAVTTVLKDSRGNQLFDILIFTASRGTYNCCIKGEAIRCLYSTNSNVTEACKSYTIVATCDKGSTIGMFVVGWIIGIAIALLGSCKFMSVFYIILYGNKWILFNSLMAASVLSLITAILIGNFVCVDPQDAVGYGLLISSQMTIMCCIINDIVYRRNSKDHGQSLPTSEFSTLTDTDVPIYSK